ncbi:helix-turn-helix transcriptional regulator [Erwinia sp. S59]|uniref:helix-turn-helix domain-containing protein n=1 Tax=Erwiniaceae TaxID=1903409 RepID=UPI00190AF73F|nr:helix-turn-helix domain-containing protein [Erwinia sp. S59]MBK0124689.1 helix-turn-helix domain-containing protein [Pantoea sp. S61]
MGESKQDWHQADIIAALRKRGTSLAAVSRAAGLCSTTLGNALIRPWPKGEWLIAEAIGVAPHEIWPSRYYSLQGELIDRQAKRRK